MHIDVYGQGVRAERVVDITDDAIERARDLLMLRLEKQKIPYRQIAKLFNTSPATVCRRLKGIPKRAREHYEAHPLVGLC